MEPKPLFCRIWQTLLDIFYLSCNSGIFEGTSDKCNNKFVAFLHIQPLHDQIISDTEIQSNLAIRNILVALKLFLNAKSSLSLWSKCQIGHRKWSLNTNLSHIKPFLIAKFDCILYLNPLHTIFYSILSQLMKFYSVWSRWKFVF